MLIRLTCACAVLAAYGYAGVSDYRHEVAEATHYDEMVCTGHWPDYEGREPECGDVPPWDAYEPPPRLP